MKWLTIVFNETIDDSSVGDEFISRFKSIYKAFNQPVGFRLYQLNSGEHKDNTYYISIPLELAFYLQIPLSVYPLQAADTPDINKLKLIVGTPSPNSLTAS